VATKVLFAVFKLHDGIRRANKIVVDKKRIQLRITFGDRS